MGQGSASQHPGAALCPYMGPFGRSWHSWEDREQRVSPRRGIIFPPLPHSSIPNPSVSSVLVSWGEDTPCSPYPGPQPPDPQPYGNLPVPHPAHSTQGLLQITSTTTVSVATGGLINRLQPCHHDSGTPTAPCSPAASAQLPSFSIWTPSH